MQKKLYLSETDKKLCGVCGGIGEYFDIDSTLIRLAWVILSFFSLGIGGIIIYIIASLIIPKRQQNF
ncbi:MAG TPA: PspC domain-containing protein [Clostridiales bacterium]|nr:PspC domain-containing protein [Clostridiales bacterium]